MIRCGIYSEIFGEILLQKELVDEIIVIFLNSILFLVNLFFNYKYLRNNLIFLDSMIYMMESKDMHFLNLSDNNLFSIKNDIIQLI